MTLAPLDVRRALLRGAAGLLFVTFALAAGCGSGKDIPVASCSRCGNVSPLTAEECSTIGQRSGCDVSSLNTSSCGGTDVPGCSFESCDMPPSCDE